MKTRKTFFTLPLLLASLVVGGASSAQPAAVKQVRQRTVFTSPYIIKQNVQTVQQEKTEDTQTLEISSENAAAETVQAESIAVSTEQQTPAVTSQESSSPLLILEDSTAEQTVSGPAATQSADTEEQAEESVSIDPDQIEEQKELEELSSTFDSLLSQISEQETDETETSDLQTLTEQKAALEAEIESLQAELAQEETETEEVSGEQAESPAAVQTEVPVETAEQPASEPEAAEPVTEQEAVTYSESAAEAAVYTAPAEEVPVYSESAEEISTAPAEETAVSTEPAEEAVTAQPVLEEAAAETAENTVTAEQSAEVYSEPVQETYSEPVLETVTEPAETVEVPAEITAENTETASEPAEEVQAPAETAEAQPAAETPEQETGAESIETSEVTEAPVQTEDAAVEEAKTEETENAQAAPEEAVTSVSAFRTAKAARLSAAKQELSEVEAKISKLDNSINSLNTTNVGSTTPNLHNLKLKAQYLQEKISLLEGMDSNEKADTINELKKELKSAQDTIESLKVTPVYRVYNPNSGEHLYTISEEEKNFLVPLGWKDEGIGWYAPLSGTNQTAIYRIYNPNSGEHFYNTDENERNTLAKAGWKVEGIAFYSDTLYKGSAIMRAFNPNATNGMSHFFTEDTQEFRYLTSIGWRDENVGMYARMVYSVTEENINGTSGITYYDMNDKKVTGKAYIAGDYYYFDKTTGLRQSGFVKDGSTISYYNTDTGTEKQNEFFTVDSSTYYANEKGAIQTGTFKKNQVTYKADSTGKIGNAYFDSVNYLSQSDPAWGWKSIGGYYFYGSGCVPTAMTMIIDTLKGTSLTPYQIGLQVHNAGYFNYDGDPGTDARGIVWLGNRFGLNIATSLNVDTATAILKSGGMLAMAMNPGTFVSAGYTHEIIAFNYEDGKVQVYDPLHPYLNNKYYLSDLFKQISTNKNDKLAGGPVFGFTRPW
jgi:hypothetical protein